MPGLRPTDDDLEMLERLAVSYRVTSPELECEVLNRTEIATSRRLDRLAKAGYLNKRRANVRLLPASTPPILHWNPGQPTPNFAALSYRLCTRWDELVPQWKTVFTITAKSLSLLALPRRAAYLHGQVSHDLGVFRMWRWATQTFPDMEFVGEDSFSSERLTGEIVEDAQLRYQGKVVAVLEFGGAYRAERLQEIHASVSASQLPYFLY